MEAQEGTEIKAITIRRESTVDCRNWLEFELSEYTMGKVRYTYRVNAPKKGCIEQPESVEF